MNRNRHSRGRSTAVMSASASTSRHTPVSSASSLDSIVAVFLAAALTVAAQSPTVNPLPEMGHMQFPFQAQMTEAPSALEVDVKLDRRSFVMNTNTCGFVSGQVSNPWTCYHTDASCTTFGYALGCCDTTLACTHTFITKCFDYTAVQSGACSAANLNTLCCPSSQPSCYGWRSITNSIAVTAWNCLDQGGFGLLISTPEVAAVVVTSAALSSAPTSTSSSFSSSSSPSTPLSSSSSTSRTSSAKSKLSSPSPSAPGDPGPTPTPVIASASSTSSTPVGAIVGGVLGGLALIAAIVFAVGLCLYRRRRAGTVGTVAPGPGPGPGPAGPPVGYPPQPQMGYAAIPPALEPGPGPMPGTAPLYNPHMSYYGGPNPQNMSPNTYYYDPSKSNPHSSVSNLYPSGPNSPNSVVSAPHLQPTSPSQFANAELQATDSRVGTTHNPAQLS